MQKVCEKCGDLFECNSENIAVCHCSKVQLSKLDLSKIKNAYSDCLCPKCLNLIAVNDLSPN